MTDAPKIYAVTQTLVIAGLVGALTLGLLPALLGGLLVYYLVDGGGKLMERSKVPQSWSKPLFLTILVASFAGLITTGVLASLSFISDGSDSFVELFHRVADIVGQVRDYLPEWMLHYMPANTREWQEAIADWLRENAGKFSVFGQEVGLFLVRLLIGMIIGAMVALKPGFKNSSGPLAVALSHRITFLGEAFKRIVFSQIRISALNTFLTALFLLLVLPVLGYSLPLAKTMILVTFIVGLLPIIGNLISNAMIFLIALSVAPIAAVWSITFLIVVHKLEYFINAQIIGTRIKAKAWELLMAMLVMETMFGIPGLIAAPIYYAYIKDELSAQRLI